MKRRIAETFSSVALASVFLTLSMVGYFPAALAEQASYHMPSSINPSTEYLFFIHNYYVEKNGPNGDCKYYLLLNAFAKSGFTVISEVRSGDNVPCVYAQKIVRQIEILLGAAVPPENITVAGHSKGGVITLCVSSTLGNPEVNFVVLAGCEIKPMLATYPDYQTLKGRFLSIYASSDSMAGSCGRFFSVLAGGTSTTEITLESDGGHRLFFEPEKIWLDPVIKCIRQREP